MFNVKDYGALGNGSNDDTSSIQSAVNAAKAVGGGVVYLPAGRYFISSSIMLASNIAIAGEGMGLTVVDCKDVTAIAFDTPDFHLSYKTLTQTAALNPGDTSNQIANDLAPGDMIAYSTSDYITDAWSTVMLREYYNKGELMEVLSANSVSLVFTEGARLSIPLANAKPALAFTPTKNVQVRDLTIDRIEDELTYSTGIRIQYCKQVLIERIQTLRCNYAGIIIDKTFDAAINTLHVLGGTAECGLDYGAMVSDGSKRVAMTDIHTTHCRHGLAGGGSGFACPMYVTADGIFITNSIGKLPAKVSPSLDAHANCLYFSYSNATVDQGCSLSGIGHSLKNIVSTDGMPFAYDGGVDLLLENVRINNCFGWYANHPIIGMTVRDCKFTITDTALNVRLALTGCTGIKFINSKIIRIGYTIASTIAALDAMFERQYGFEMGDDCALINCVIEGFPTAIYVNGKNCLVKDCQLKNTGWSTTLSAYQTAILVSKNAEFSVLDGIIIENGNEGFAFNSRSIRFDAIGTGSGKSITLKGMKHGRDNAVSTYYGIYADVAFTKLFLMDNYVLATANTINGTGKFFNNSFVANN